MQFRSIISVFIVICLIVVTFFSNVVEGGKVLDNTNQNSINSNKNSYFGQRLRRKARNTNQRYKRDDGYGGDNNYAPGGDSGNNMGGGDGYQQPSQSGYQSQPDGNQNQGGYGGDANQGGGDQS